MSDRPSSYRYLDFNAPLSGEHADRIARRLADADPAVCLDIGCGWAELLLRVLEQAPHASGTGLDNDAALVARGMAAVTTRGLEGRARIVELDGAASAQTADLVLCVGASHALSDDLPDALAQLHEHVRPGGRLLLGEGYWEPTGDVEETLVWDDLLALPSLPELVDRSVEAGFRPLWVETASAQEWEDFESGFLADLQEWLMLHADDDGAEEVRREADTHLPRWLRGYRNGLKFAYLTLGVPR